MRKRGEVIERKADRCEIVFADYVPLPNQGFEIVQLVEYFQMPLHPNPRIVPVQQPLKTRPHVPAYSNLDEPGQRACIQPAEFVVVAVVASDPAVPGIADRLR